MRHKWQYFVIGLLSGFLLAGIAVMMITDIRDSEQAKRIRAIGEMTVTLSADAYAAKEPDKTDKNVGKIDINQASIAELMALPNIGETKAKAIVEFREKYGNFQSIDELLYVSGIGKEVYGDLVDLVYIHE